VPRMLDPTASLEAKTAGAAIGRTDASLAWL